MKNSIPLFTLALISMLPGAGFLGAQNTVGTAAPDPATPNMWEKQYNDGTAAFQANNYREAEKQLKAAIKSTREFASNDPKLLKTLDSLSQVLRAQSKYTEAEPLMERHLTLRERILGKFHPDLAKDIDELGRICFAQMKFVSSEAYFRRELAILEKKFGPEYMELIPTLTNIAQSCQALKRP